MKKFLAALALGAAAAPIAAIATFLLVPLWRWIEAATGIESIGHSGPANWCFVAVYVVALALGISVWMVSGKNGPSPPENQR